MKLRWHYWLLFVAMSSTFAFWLGRTDSGRIIWNRWICGSPILECPTAFDLGERDSNSRAIVPFSIVNRGRSSLLISEVRTSCVCAGMELDNGEDYPRLTSIELGGGEAVRVRVKVNISGRPGRPFEIPIQLSSNDPFRPHQTLVFRVSRVKGGTIWEPESFAFGEVSLGTPKTKSLELFDTSADRRIVERVESTPPDSLLVRFIPELTASLTNDGWHRLGRVEVTVPASNPGPINGTVSVRLMNEPDRIDLIPVFGEVMEPAIVSPKHVVLPIRTSAGLREETRCLIRRTDGNKFTLQIVEKPEEFDVVTLAVEPESLVHYISIRRIPGKIPSKQSLILIRTNQGNQTYDLRLPTIWLEEAHHVESSATGLHAR